LEKLKVIGGLNFKAALGTKWIMLEGEFLKSNCEKITIHYRSVDLQAPSSPYGIILDVCYEPKELEEINHVD